MGVDQGTYLAPSKMTVREWLVIWQKGYLSSVKPSTVYLYSKNIESYINPVIGSIKLETLTPPAIQAMYNGLYKPDNSRRPLSAKTIKNIHGVLHKALQQAVAVSYLRFNPANACTSPRVIHKERYVRWMKTRFQHF